MIVAHADWGTNPRKQWVAVAVRDSRGRWSATAPQRVLGEGPLRKRLHVRSESEVAFLGFDCPIGIPRAYAARAGVSDFIEFLYASSEEAWRQFSHVADDRDEIRIGRPFYPDTYLSKGSRKREHLTSALQVEFADLLRRCDRATSDRRAACALFWTCGGQQVGKGALAGWQLLRDERRDRTAFWPFDGNLVDLLISGATVVAETYPAEFYRHLGLGNVVGKGHQAVRVAHSEALANAAADLTVEPHPELDRTLRDGFGPTPTGEDQFDALVGLLGMLNVLEGGRAPGVPTHDPAVTTIEGWILGQQ
jgi:Protein of unknown function (DUF429)